MNGTHAVLGYPSVFVGNLLQQVPDFIAMRQASRASDIPRHKDLFVAGYYAPASAAVAGSPFGNGVSHFHEIVIP